MGGSDKKKLLFKFFYKCQDFKFMGVGERMKSFGQLKYWGEGDL